MSVPSQPPAPDKESRGTDPVGGKTSSHHGPPVPAAVSAGGTATAMAEPRAELPEPAIQLPLWSRVLGWCAAVGLIYLLICGVNILSRGFRDLSGDAAHTMFAFAGNPWVGLSVGILATVLAQSSTATTAIAITAVGSGALPIRGAIPIILGANVGTTVTCTLVALTFAGNRDQFRRALAASTIHDMYNLLALAIFFPLELIFHPLEHLSGHLTNWLYGISWLPDPSRFNIVRTLTRPVVDAVSTATSHLSEALGPLFTIVIGAAVIMVAVLYLSKMLKTLMVGKARDSLTKVVGGNPYVAMAAGTGVTVVTQSSTVTNSILVPFAGVGALTPKQVYPVTLGANLGTTLTGLLAAFAVNGPYAKVGLQAAFVHLVYNVLAIIVIFVIPVLRPVPLWCAETLARVAVERKWVVALYLIAVFIVLPALVIILAAVGVINVD
jgi:solute carrier family 34 (sodium-dependent phosphate cotransporter)